MTQELGSGLAVSQSGEVHGIVFLDASTFVSVSAGNKSVARSAELRCFAVAGSETLLETLDGRSPDVRRRPRAPSSAALARRRGLLLVGNDAGEVEVWRAPGR